MREATAETVGKFSEYVVPDFLDLHEKIMPCLLTVLKELTPANDMTIQKGLFALHEFTTNLNEDIKLYLHDSVSLIMNFLTNPTFSRDARYWALMALGSVVSSAEKKIIPYQEVILKTLYDTITNQNTGQTEI